MSFLRPVILSGGAGSRLWPLSRTLFPKQLLALNSQRSLIQDTVARATGPQFGPPLIVCNVEHRFLIAEQMREVGVVPSVILEPEARNTAPAAAVAALIIAEQDPKALMLLMPADHVVRDEAAFLQAMGSGAAAAREGHLVTFGIAPTAPETGYGYIRQGRRVSVEGCFSVVNFVEKPDAATAGRYIAGGEYSWNSGIFLFETQTFLDELALLQPGLLCDCRAAVANAKREADFFRLEASAFEKCPSISIDHAVMEHTKNAVVVPVQMGWSDIGSWEALWIATSHDEQGNATRGDVVHHAVRNSYLRSEGPLVAAVGVEDLVVVATSDAVLVSQKSASQNVKHIVEQLKAKGRDLHHTHRKVFRPWGSYDSIETGENFQVKHIVVNPGAKLSLQMHHKRAEHWIVLAGEGRITCDEKVFALTANQSTYIPQGAKHRLENLGPAPLHLIEVQSGSYLGEDDIVRFEDAYGRQ